MTGIERHWEEERKARLAEFQRRWAALRAEFADLRVAYVDHVFGADEVIEVWNRPGEIVEVRKPIRRTRWSWS